MTSGEEPVFHLVTANHVYKHALTRHAPSSRSFLVRPESARPAGRPRTTALGPAK
ncbi:hypothetical protein [Haladaptatus litoreus]|uniref:hypothetical protein n=1 Tax=Haladaptatus litoreus TaxID=553468 RepID=UPI00158CA021|nr:hypothetical protein [Haladaptatus litoreus]